MSSNKSLPELLSNVLWSSGSKLSQTFKNVQISCQFQRICSFVFSLSYGIEHNHHCFYGVCSFYIYSQFVVAHFNSETNGTTQLYKTSPLSRTSPDPTGVISTLKLQPKCLNPPVRANGPDMRRRWIYPSS